MSKQLVSRNCCSVSKLSFCLGFSEYMHLVSAQILVIRKPTRISPQIIEMEGLRRRCCNSDVLPFTVMVGMECLRVGSTTIFKAASMDNGLSNYVLVTYSYFIAALFLLPSHFLYRPTTGSALPPLGFRILCKFLLLSLVGCCSLMLSYQGISYSSPTLAAALGSLIPAFIFILAILFRMENLAWRSSSSQAKVIGTVVSMGGALMVIFYKGPAIILIPQNFSAALQGSLDSSDSDWALGGFLITSASIVTSIWYILQADAFRDYPAEFVVMFYYNLFGGLISGMIGFVCGANPSAWSLKFDESLAAVLYSGLLGSFLTNSVHAWIMHRKGPVYVAMFRPLSIAIAAIMGVMFLRDTLHLGSIIGAIVISLGFYAVMWGKAAEEMQSSPEKTPLLPSIKEVHA